MGKLSEIIGAVSEKEIIKKIVNGEIALFEVLVRRYNPVLYKIARSFGFNHQDTEDLVQETHVTAYTDLKNFEHRATYKTWISKIIIHKCVHTLKSGYFKHEKLHEDIIDENLEPVPSTKDSQGTESTIINRELSKVLESSLQYLPVSYRTVFILREIEGFNVAETAELLNISSINVKVRLNRAKVMLRQQLEKFYSYTDIYDFNLNICDNILEGVFQKISPVLSRE